MLKYGREEKESKVEGSKESEMDGNGKTGRVGTEEKDRKRSE